MKRKILITSLSSIGLLLLSAFYIEGDDINTIGFYFTIFIIPLLFFCFINGVIIYLIQRLRDKRIKKLFFHLPIVTLLILSMLDSEVPIFSGSLTYVSLIAVFSIGIPNIIWSRNIK